MLRQIDDLANHDGKEAAAVGGVGGVGGEGKLVSFAKSSSSSLLHIGEHNGDSQGQGEGDLGRRGPDRAAESFLRSLLNTGGGIHTHTYIHTYTWIF